MDMSEERTESLGEALPKEIARCKEVLATYRSIGPAGQFGAMMIEKALKLAEGAIVTGDVGCMIKAYEELKGIE
jgi:hypothetical protein